MYLFTSNLYFYLLHIVQRGTKLRLKSNPLISKTFFSKIIEQILHLCIRWPHMFTNASYSSIIINNLPFHSQMSMGSDEKFCSYYI